MTNALKVCWPTSYQHPPKADWLWLDDDMHPSILRTVRLLVSEQDQTEGAMGMTGSVTGISNV